MSEVRDDGFIVDINGGFESRPVGRTPDGKHSVVVNQKQEKEFTHLSKESRLMRAMTEIRGLGAKHLSPAEREKLKPQLEAIVKKYGLETVDFGL